MNKAGFLPAFFYPEKSSSPRMKCLGSIGKALTPRGHIYLLIIKKLYVIEVLCSA